MYSRQNMFFVMKLGKHCYAFCYLSNIFLIMNRRRKETQDHRMYEGAEYVQHNDVLVMNFFVLLTYIYIYFSVISTWGWAHNLTIGYLHNKVFILVVVVAFG
jgi:hypothetical protein